MVSNVFNTILKEYEAIRDTSLLELETRKSEIYRKFLRIQEIDDKINGTSVEITKTILKSSNDAQKLINELEQKVMDFKIEKGELLASHNYPTDYLTLRYKCKICHDTGFVKTQKCGCLKQKLINYYYNQSNLSSTLKDENFDTFNFKYYSDIINNEKGLSPKENMQSIYKTCLNFASHFNDTLENLLFTGSTGLGKTFLSSCIAKELLDKEKTVFYQTAFKVFNILEEYKFNKDKTTEAKNKVDLLFDVDFLIIDDLGTEFINSYTSSEFFNILNTRLLGKKKTLISTNLNMNELFNTYSARVTSRIWGQYKVLEFFGDDIRKKVSVNSQGGIA